MSFEHFPHSFGLSLTNSLLNRHTFATHLCNTSTIALIRSLIFSYFGTSIAFQLEPDHLILAFNFHATHHFNYTGVSATMSASSRAQPFTISASHPLGLSRSSISATSQYESDQLMACCASIQIGISTSTIQSLHSLLSELPPNSSPRV